MSPPPQPCQVPDCDYSSPPNLPNYDLVYRDLTLHFQMAHHALAVAAHAGGGGDAGHGPGLPQGAAAAATVKPEKPRRPQLADECSDADYNWFLEQWGRYRRRLQLEGKQATDELWDCVSPELARRCFEAGVKETADEETMLAMMKKMAIKATNKLCNIVDFLSMGQGEHEPVTNYIAKLKGQAKTCSFVITCTEETCQHEVNYSEEMIAHQLLRGLLDSSVQEKVFALAATDKDLSLKKMEEFIIAQETGVRSTKMLAEGAGINRVVTDYQRGRSNTMPSLHPRKKDNCDYCGGGAHKDKKDCPAWNQRCERCGKENHLAKVCRSKEATAGANAVYDEEAVELFTVTAGVTNFQPMTIGGWRWRGGSSRPTTGRRTNHDLEMLFSDAEDDQPPELHEAARGAQGEGGDIQYPGVRGKPPSGATHMELTTDADRTQSAD